MTLQANFIVLLGFFWRCHVSGASFMWVSCLDPDTADFVYKGFERNLASEKNASTFWPISGD